MPPQTTDTTSAGLPSHLMPPLSYLPSSLFICSGILAPPLSCQLLENSVCDFSVTTGPAQCPAYGGFLTHGSDVIRQRGRSTVGLQLRGGQQYSPLRVDYPSLQLSDFEYWVEGSSRYFGGPEWDMHGIGGSSGMGALPKLMFLFSLLSANI